MATVHRSRKLPWSTVSLSALSATALTVGALLPTSAQDQDATAQDQDVQELVVDLGERTGEFRGAASGALYGLSDEGVPSDNTLEPLRMTTVNQKPPAGAQHPNGDALVVADSFFRTGGEYIQINVQDMYAQWTYEDLGFDDYMEKLAWVVDQVSNSSYADRIVYVPFNEPDGIWYNLGTGNQAAYEQNMATFLSHWKTAVEYIREHHEGARVMGTNDATFRTRNYGDFLTFARDNDVLPDFVSWHQLHSDSLDSSSPNYFRDNYEEYRALEQERGIDPIPININEYGGNRDLTVPGQLVQWTSMLEEKKVDAGGKAYWTAAGLLGGDVVETNKPGAGWWFYKMYADMHGGDTVTVETTEGGHAVSRVPGQFGNAIAPQGPEPNQYVEMPDGVLNELTDMTIATWVNWNGNQNWSRIFDFGSGTSVNMFLTPDVGGPDGLRLAITTNGAGGEQRVTSSEALPSGWQHVAVTLQGDTATIWLNGEELASSDNVTLDPADLGTTTQNYIGRSQYSDPLFNGAVDEFQIYDRALTQDEIASLLDSPGGTTGGGNVAWYQFDETGGAAALDSSGNGNDATIATVAGVDALEAIAVIDDERRQARIVAGGTADPFDVVVENVDPETFGDTVHVRLAASTWSGQNSDAPPPEVLLEEDVAVDDDGSVTVPVRGHDVHGDGGTNVDRMAAYEIVLSPGGTGRRETVDRPWRAAYEAEDATITAGQVNTRGTPQNWNAPAASGNQDVGALDQPDSAVTFDVEVPEAGEYRLSIMYANQTGQPSQQILTVNGDDAQFVDYQATMNWAWRTRTDVVVELDQGNNEIRLAKSHPDLGTAEGQATLDRIDLERITGDGPVTRHYEAELAQYDGAVELGYDHPQQSGAGHISLRRGAESTFVVYAEQDGYYDLDFRYSAPGRPGSEVGQISLDRRPVEGAMLRAAPGGEFWHTQTERLFLSAGVNRVTVEQTGRAPLRLDHVSATRATSGSMPVQEVEAEAAMLSGSAEVESHGYASGGEYVGSVGQGPDNRVTFDVEAEEAGEHLLVVHYANDERDTGHPYNADIISRPIDISVNGDEPTRHWFKNTWSWGNWWARGVPVTLQEGTNTLVLYNDPAQSATAEGCPSPCMPVLDSEWAPYLDKFEIAPIRIP
ncbi:LamG-like jellyroll fold domain-containing protein [Phytoactinopolyspora halotolerans]|uniref:CBM6 domain-containing protein n=1 Tax=Phytoactinopolyspora halotolerans TaxID=1981512 RepID=A0A6L9SAQ3_9ACTN|nr:LamG-like jellyroll fold domain-containing protein [Phytoactinopolyspora halotolerans]NEE01704.1 hypothetical protein [Phytoactinopolyspora halotolerans]